MKEQIALSKTYSPKDIEKPIYNSWLESGVFHAVPDHRPRNQRYVIMMPLPNITGALHMGHAMDNVMQDLLIRWHRMRGDNTLWMPGTDHAGIATQAVIEKRLKELEGLTRYDIGRDGLVARIYEWKDKYQARIVAQLQQMGCSCDWDRKRFTMDKVCARAVRHTFFRLFRDGLIARGKRLINWDTYLRTSISDDEVVYETVQGYFWHLRYPVIDPAPGEPAYLEVATTRPETMLGDTAVAVHPDPAGELRRQLDKAREALATATDKTRSDIEREIELLEQRQQTVLPLLEKVRDMALAGRYVMLPLVNRPIPIIGDPWAKPALGTGMVKITPAHDHNDYDVYTRHKAEIGIINILNPDGTLNANAGPYQGLDRMPARAAVTADLQKLDLIGAIEEREVEIGHSDRSKTPIEPYLSDQWFVRMGDIPGGVVMGRGTDKEFRAPGLVQAAIDAVVDGRVTFHPERFAKGYLDWLSEKRDWPVSRQLWWGHRIPVWSLQTAAANLASEVQRIFAAGIGGFLNQQQAFIRAVQPDDGLQLIVTCPADVAQLPAATADAWTIDVCLLDDDPAALALLHNLGYAQSEDVLDTWFSSALWPHSTLGWPDPATAALEGTAPLGPEHGADDCLSYYYPGSCLVTGRDIITLWIARMVITGLYNLGDVPFTDTFIHANILDGKGERMSKSKGNGIDPVDIIAEYGADAMRYVLAEMQTGNQDIKLPVNAICPACNHSNDLALIKHGGSIFTYICSECSTEFDVLGTIEGIPAARLLSERFQDGRRFCNKLWNTVRFALGHLEAAAGRPAELGELEIEDRWILAELTAGIRSVTNGLEEYNPSAAIGAARDLMWSKFCDWYLELIKPRMSSDAGRSGEVARQVLAFTLDQILRLLHPFIPFVTEYLYSRLHEQMPFRGLSGLGADVPSNPLLAAASWPVAFAQLEDPALTERFADMQAVTTSVRDVRSAFNVPSQRQLTVTLRPPESTAEEFARLAFVLKRLAGVDCVNTDPQAARPANSVSKVSGAVQIFVHNLVDDAQERERLRTERERIEKEIGLCDAKLTNEGFISRAPADVVAKFRERREKYVAQLLTIGQALADLDT